jgi:hypothetical protein
LDDWKRNLAKGNRSTNNLNLMGNQMTCLNASINLSKLPITSNYDANTNPSNQYEMRRDDFKKFATWSCVNAKFKYLPQLTLTMLLPNKNVMPKFE